MAAGQFNAQTVAVTSTASLVWTMKVQQAHLPQGFDFGGNKTNGILLYNSGTVAVFVGNSSSVAASGGSVGFQIPVGGSLTIPGNSGANVTAIWAIVASTSGQLSIWDPTMG